MNNPKSNMYIPEYNPSKYKKAAKISKIISVISLIAMILGVLTILLQVYLNSDFFLVRVNGVLQKDWNWICICLGIVISTFGLTSLFVYILYIRLKQANAIFSEPDESKRLEMNMKYVSGASKAAKIHAASATTNIASNFKNKKYRK